MNALRILCGATCRSALLAGRVGLTAAVVLTSTAVDAAVELGAAAKQTGRWLGLTQYFYDSGWDERVGAGSVAAGHALVDVGAFAVSSHISSSVGLYQSAGSAVTRRTTFSSDSLANVELQGSVKDVIHVTSNSLPVGTPVSIEVRAYLGATAVPGVRSTLTLGGLPYFVRIDGGSGASPTQLLVRQADDWFRVGDSILVNSTFRLSVGVEGGDSGVDALSLGSFSIRANCLACGFDTLRSAGEVASASALGFIVQNSPVTLVADSGHDYSVLVVPEPSTYVLLLTGALAVGAATARRRRFEEGAAT